MPLSIRQKYQYGFRDNLKPTHTLEPGLSKKVVEEISSLKNEPDWMRKKRLEALEIFFSKPVPNWGADLSKLDFDQLRYYIRPTDRKGRSWDEVPAEIKRTFDRIGVPQAEKNFLAGVEAQYDSEVIYGNLKKEWEDQGIIFCDTDTAVQKYPEIVKQYFGTVVPAGDNKFAALNSAVWSGGSFVYVPAGKSVTVPLQAYFRINQDRFGQFERTLIIAEKGATVHYVEGCLPAGEQIALGDRWANIEQVKPGDFVPTETGLFSKVKAIITRPYHGDLVVIRPISRYNTFRLTPEHPVLAIRRPAVLVKRQPRKHWKGEVSTKLLKATKSTYIPAGELREGDFLVYPKIKPRTANRQLSREQLRLLGYYLAEGSAYLHKILNVHVVSFSFGLKERRLVREVRQLIRTLAGKRAMEIRSPHKHGTEIRVYSRELHDFVLEHAGKGAASKKLSSVVMAQPDEPLRELVETYAAGDGNISLKGNSEMRRLITASEGLARQLQEILSRLGIYASIQFRKGGGDTFLGRQITRGDQWWVVYTYNKSMGEVRECDDYFFVPVKEIKREPYTGMVFNLDVEAPNSYLVRGFAVHNCTAPIYRTDSLHAAVVEVIVKKGARVRYTTIQNWSSNIYNLVTKRAFVGEDAVMEWVDGNLGSKVTMKYPSVFLWGKGARGDVLSVALAGQGQHQDAGAKAIHLAPYTSSTITSKSVSHSGGKTTYRGQLKIIPGAKGAKSNVRCDALILDNESSSETIPVMNILEKDVTIGHEASVGRVSEDQLFYLMSRGINGNQALSMIVNGFIEPITKELPLEYAVELNRLIRLEMEGSVG